MRIVIVGGHSRIARLMLPRLAARGDEAVALVRRPEQFEAVRALGGEPVLIDLEHLGAGALVPSFTGADAIVFAASSGDGTPEQLWTVDFGGVTASIEAAKRAGVTRFVHVSSLGVGDTLPGYVSGPWWEAYFGAKREADAALAASGLEWTSVRPGQLTDREPTGTVQVADRLPYSPVSRADVADTIIASLDSPATVGRAFDLIGGPTPVADALNGLT
ncbi:SDR family oxidoreductase [Streptomyces sp. NPDC051569]|uniref:SDR family oxidoreductase n=1 Tax=Streptomyces sp. NPDC051569 TaxID=3365661 RepID=UPI00379444CA